MVQTRPKKRQAMAKAKPFHAKRHMRDPDEISSDSELDDSEPLPPNLPDSESDNDETAQEKKMRLTKKYLDQLRTLQEGSDEEGKDFVGDKLKEDVLEQAGRLQRKIAHLCVQPDEEQIKRLKGHKLSVTCLTVSSDNNFMFTASKDRSIIKWCLKTYSKLATVKSVRSSSNQKAHSCDIFSLSLTTDFKFLASAGKDKLIFIWNPETMQHIHTFKGHRDSISGLAFRLNSHQLFSSSHDRTVKVWDLDIMGYVETLYGHQEAVQACDSLTRERCASCGGRDGSVRIWKIVEESQLLYHGHTGSIDCVRFINEEYMISGSDDGSVCIWSIMKKKPIVVIRNAHGQKHGLANWISSVAGLPNSDLVATGSCDGFIRLWKCGEKFLKMTPLFIIPVQGFVNDLRFTKNGRFLVAAVGQEHKLGRWWSLKEARNSTLVIPLNNVN